MSPLPLLVAVSPAFAADVVVFGDSWAEGAADELEEVLADRGHPEITVDPRGVGGTTAEYWAVTLPDALPDAVSANPDARWVWLSIGGNDLFAHYYAGAGAQNAADYSTHLRAMLDRLFAVHPDVKVVSFGYDFTNFEQSTDCILLAWTYFGTRVTTGLINQAFLDDVGETLRAVAADYPNFTYVDAVWGTLQREGGVAGAPNVLLPSPAQYMSDCIHPTGEGYTYIQETLVDAYWGTPAPTVAIVGAHDTCVGAPVTLTASSTGAERLAWRVDGVDAGSEPTLVVPADAPATSAVELRADAGAWDATDAVSVSVWPVPTPAVTGPSAVDAGRVATFQVALAAGEWARWTAPGGTVVDGAEADTVVVRWDAPGDYVLTVEVSSPGGCAVEGEVAVAVDAVADSGGTPEPDDTGSAGDDPPAGGGETKPDGCGCGAGAPGGGGAWLLPLVVVAVRARRALSPPS